MNDLLATDAKAWHPARAHFVDRPIDFDISSLVGDGTAKLAAEQLFEGFPEMSAPAIWSDHMASTPVAKATAHRILAS